MDKFRVFVLGKIPKKKVVEVPGGATKENYGKTLQKSRNDLQKKSVKNLRKKNSTRNEGIQKR